MPFVPLTHVQRILRRLVVLTVVWSAWSTKPYTLAAETPQDRPLLVVLADGGQRLLVSWELTAERLTGRTEQNVAVESLLPDVISLNWPQQSELTKQSDRQQTAIRLSNDDLLFVAQVELLNDQLQCRWQGASIMIPLEYVDQLLMGTSFLHWKELPKVAEASDLLWLTNGDLLRGTVLDFQNEKLRMESTVGDVTIQGEQIAGLAFHQELQTVPHQKPNRTLVLLQDGSHLTADSWRLDQSTQEYLLESAVFSGPVRIPAQAVSRLLQMNEQRRSLPGWTPTNFQSENFWGRSLTFENNRNVLRQQLISNGFRSPLGIGVRSRSRLDFALPAQAGSGPLQLVWSVGLDARVHSPAASEVSVEVDGQKVWSGQLSTWNSPLYLHQQLEVSEGKQVSLITDFGPGADIGGQVNWFDLLLIPAATGSPP